MNELIFLASSLMLVFFVYIAHRFLANEGLMALIALFAVFANFFVQKQITLFGLNATASDLYAVGSFFALNILLQRSGYKVAQKGIIISFVSLVFFCWASQMHLRYIPSDADITQHTYANLLQPMPLLLLASLVAYFVSQQLNAFLFYTLNRIRPHSLTLNQFISLCSSQLLDTFLFGVIGLRGTVDALGEVILFSYLIKLICIVIITLLSAPFWRKEKTPDVIV